MKLRMMFCLWLLMGLFASVVMAEPVAMVTDTSDGAFTLTNGKIKKIALLSYLEPGMTLQLDQNAHLAATFFTKPVEYHFTGPAKLMVEQDRILVIEGKAETRTVSLTKTSAARKFTAAQRENVAQAAYEMRAGRSGLRLNDPVDTRLTGNAFAFSWDGPRPVDGYQINLYDSHKRLLHQTSFLTANSWAPSAGLLKAGNSYEWEVRANMESGEVLTARGSFSVADSATAKTVQAQSPPADASFSERVLYAIFLEEKGFKYDARCIWRELAKERPDDAVVKEHSIR